jgi:hypothetical protein
VTRINTAPALRRMLEGEGYLPTVLVYIPDPYIAAVLNCGLDSFLLGEDPRKMYKTVGAAADAVNEAAYNSNTLLPPSCGYTEATRYVAFL